MSYTTTQLADAVLRKLTVTTPYETPDSTLRSVITDAYAAFYEEYAAPGQELMYWDVDAPIPNAVFGIIRDFLVIDCASEFGKEPLNIAQKDAMKEPVIKRLRRHVAVQSAGLPVRSEYL